MSTSTYSTVCTSDKKYRFGVHFNVRTYVLTKQVGQQYFYTIRCTINRYTHSYTKYVDMHIVCTYVDMYILTYIPTYVCTKEQYVYPNIHTYIQVLYYIYVCTYICTLCKPCEGLTCDITGYSVTVQGVTMVTCAETRSNCVDTPMLTPTIVDNTFVNICRSREY